MAWTTGTATNYRDLLGKLRDYLVANGWEAHAGATSGTPANGDFVSFRGFGLAGDDDILCTIQCRGDAVAGYYNLLINGHTGYNPQIPGMAQSGNHYNPVVLPLLNTTIKYWFIVNPRCFKVICRTNGRYDVAYVGLILPDHAPTDWAYPMFVGASSYDPNMNASDNANSHSNFWQPFNDSTASNPASQAYLLSPGGAWRYLANTRNTSGPYQSRGCMTYPWAPGLSPLPMARTIDGKAWLMRGALVQVGDGFNLNAGGAPDINAPDGGVWYGSFDGVFYTPSFEATVEEIVTEGGVDHLLVGNVNRVSDGNFAAFALEV